MEIVRFVIRFPLHMNSLLWHSVSFTVSNRDHDHTTYFIYQGLIEISSYQHVFFFFLAVSSFLLSHYFFSFVLTFWFLEMYMYSQVSAYDVGGGANATAGECVAARRHSLCDVGRKIHIDSEYQIQITRPAWLVPLLAEPSGCPWYHFLNYYFLIFLFKNLFAYATK